MKPHTSISATAVAASNSNGRDNTTRISGSSNVFPPTTSATGTVKEGLVSQIASKFQNVGDKSTPENELDRLSAKRKKSDTTNSVHKYSSSNVTSQSSDNIRLISNSGDYKMGSHLKDNSRFHSIALRKPSSTKSQHPAGDINRTDSHQARFHNARAMFEKMGSADDLDNMPTSPTVNNPPSFLCSGKPLRALSVGSKPAAPDNFLIGKLNSSNTPSITSSYNSNLGLRSRSTSPFGGSRSSSQSSLKQSTLYPLPDSSGIVRSSSGNFVSRNSTTSIKSGSNSESLFTNGNITSDAVDLVSHSMNGHLSGTSTTEEKDTKTNGNRVADKNGSNLHESVSPKSRSIPHNDSDNNNIKNTKPIKTDIRKGSFNAANSEEAIGHKSSVGSMCRPNIKELTNKQRNWFSNFERGKTSASGAAPSENVESARRSSVKDENVTNILSDLDKSGSNSESTLKNTVPDSTPTPTANLNLPGDRRPINFLSSGSSDSIEDYIRNWKGDSIPESWVGQGESTINDCSESGPSSGNLTPQSSGPSSLDSDLRHRHLKNGNKYYNRLEASRDSSSKLIEKASRPPVLSPKPNPDVVKRFSFNKSKQSEDSKLFNALADKESLKHSSISQTKYDNNIKPSNLKLGCSNESSDTSRLSADDNVFNWRKNGIIGSKQTDTSRVLEGKSSSGSIVRKLSAEYASKIKQDDQTPSKSKAVSQITSATKNKPVAASPIEIKEVSNQENNLNFNASISNSTSTDPQNNSDISRNASTFLNNQLHNKEFHRLASEIDCNKADTLVENETSKNEVKCRLQGKSKQVNENEIHTKIFEKDTLLKDKSSLASSSNVSHVNSPAMAVPFDETESINKTHSPRLKASSKDNFSTAEGVFQSPSQLCNLDLNLQKVCRPKLTEQNTSNQFRGSNLPTAPKENLTTEISPNTNEGNDNKLYRPNVTSSYITTSCAVGTVLEKNDDNDQDMSGDEFQDEIHFDPTISSGHLGYDKEGDFRNTPITLGGTRDAIITPQLDSSYIQTQGKTTTERMEEANKYIKEDKCKDETIPLPMSPKEEENLLSNKIAERRGVLSDAQAEEVKALLTPEKDLPPIPDDDNYRTNEGHSMYYGTQTDLKSSTMEPEPSSDTSSKSDNTGQVNSAIGKLDSLVYRSTNGSNIDNDIRQSSDETGKQVKVEIINDSGVVYERPKPNEETYYDEESKVHYYSDGHYWVEVAGLDSTENAILSPSERLPPGCYKKPGKLRFSTEPIKQFSTYSVDDYDRRNDDVDPVAASGMKAQWHRFSMGRDMEIEWHYPHPTKAKQFLYDLKPE